MQQDNNDMSNKFRQLENQQLPDLSNMDKHWHEMKHMLAAGVSQNNNKSKSFIKLHFRKLFIAAASISVLFAAWFFRNIPSDSKNITRPSVTATTTPAKSANNPVSGIIQPSVTTLPQKQDQFTSKQVARTESGNKKEPELAMESTLDPGTNIPDESIALEEDNAKKILTAFYGDIQNSVQEFNINAEEGASLTGREGTIISIPASAFIDEEGKIVSGKVEVKLEEFYKYSDMIAANLTTISDGKQLVTDGMIRITASSNGTNVSLRSKTGINLIMPATHYDPAMSLFTAEADPETNSYASYAVVKRDINWNLTGRQDAMPVFDKKTNVLDDLDQPYNVIKTFKKRIAKFSLSKKSPLTTEQMKAVLKEKYGDYYDVIKVKQEGGQEKASNFFFRGKLEKDNVIGDSVRLTLDQAVRQKYIEKKDIAFYAEKIKADSIRFFNEYAKTKNAYQFTVTKLGWINCDKYANHSGKTSFVINLPADVKAERFVTQLVFMSTRSVMPGRTINNQIGFRDIPDDMGVYIVGLGERNGKVVSFMQKLKIGGSEVNIHELQETTPEAFRKKLTELDMN